MIITKIKQIARTNRYHIYLDDQWFGIFMDETLAMNKLKTGQEIDKDEIEQIKRENDKKLSFDMAVSYMEKYVVSSKGIKDYLKKKGFDDLTIANTIEKLEEYGYVNDEKFAENYFDSLSASQGKNVIANKLRTKGISKQIIDDLMQKIDEDTQLENAIVLAKKFVKNREKTAKTKQKCIAHLIYKGYDYSVAQKATNVVTDITYEGENDDWI
ncbi:MAG: RecX family transcriptional regulator [Clostridia bacterium]|nr:RecX family transcriptional regulator [Clostridia bacterium]